MSSTLPADYQNVLESVGKWPMEFKLALATELVQTCRMERDETPTQRVSVAELHALLGDARRQRPVEELIGMGAGSGPPPDDEEVDLWVAEHRMSKHPLWNRL